MDVKQASTAPGEGTVPYSINLVGAVTGEFLDVNSAMHGFSRVAGGVVQIFDAPGAGNMAFQGTRPSTNNMDGEVVGGYVVPTTFRMDLSGSRHARGNSSLV